jgi:hypothetical protein
LYCDAERKWKNYHIILFLDCLFPKRRYHICEQCVGRWKVEDRKMRKMTWEAARWPWGWERVLTFEGGGSGSRCVEEPFWRRLWTGR